MDREICNYEDVVDVVGEVTMVRVGKPRMAIEVEGREVEADFRPEDEEVITTALKNHSTAKLRVIGRGQYNRDGSLQRVVAVEKVSLLPTGQLEFDESAKSIWDEFDEIISQIPPEELARLPTDAAERHDHYLHGPPEEAR